MVAQESDTVPLAFEKALGTAGGATEADPFDPVANAPKMIQVQVEYIELSHELLPRFYGILVTLPGRKPRTPSAMFQR